MRMLYEDLRFFELPVEGAGIVSLLKTKDFIHKLCTGFPGEDFLVISS
jgi:hypothetical protein